MHNSVVDCLCTLMNIYEYAKIMSLLKTKLNVNSLKWMYFYGNDSALLKLYILVANATKLGDFS